MRLQRSNGCVVLDITVGRLIIRIRTDDDNHAQYRRVNHSDDSPTLPTE
jgi:hypothetical protein